MNVGVNIARWSFWSGEAAAPEDWLAYWRRPDACSKERAVPGNGIPPSLKRRMSTLSQMAIHAGLATGTGAEPDYVVFCSQHGEVARTKTLLDSIVRGVELSPTAFSQSVHNSGAGLFSIITRSTAPATSLASGESTFAYGWLEAEAYLMENRQASVLLVCYDEALPIEYRPYCSRVQSNYAVALLLRAAPERGIFLERGHAADIGEALPLAPSFMAWWLSSEPAFHATAGDERWLWSRNHHGP